MNVDSQPGQDHIIDSQENLDPAAEAEQTLLSLVEGLPPLDPTGQSKYFWHIKLRLAEIAENGGNSVYSLIPLVARVHTNAVSAFSNNGIHTKTELSGLVEDDVRKFRGIRNTLIEARSMKVIVAIRNLATAQLELTDKTSN